MVTPAEPPSPRTTPPSLYVHDHGRIKKRELRKGTHSCWECKRRKMRCVFDVTPTRQAATVCQGCRRRGSACVTQEVPEGLIRGILGNTGRRDIQDAGATDRSTSIMSTPAARRDNEPPTPVSTSLNSSQQQYHEHNLSATPRDSTPGRAYEDLSHFLHASLPSLEDTRIIHCAKPTPAVPAHELMTMPYTTLFQSDLESSASLLEIPDATWHPVLIARHMLMLASSLQHLHPDVHPQVRALSETPRAVSERLAGLANRFVTSKDDMLGSIEGLECILIESVYHANLGNLRRSWVTARRALSIAQLMGIHRSDRRTQYEILNPTRTHDSQVLWSRIVFLDRFLCLMLGLPAGCADNTGMPPETASPTDIQTGRRLERIHCIVASRILERGSSDPTSQDLLLTQELDLELQKAARSLPAKWWLTPKLESTRADPTALFWNTGRMFAQVIHYNLLNQLHLPYMLRSSPTDRTFEYSCITCVNASREILWRFIALRSFNGIASSCRLIDFIALMASLTLLLTHMDSSASGYNNLLAHQYHSDRAMIEQVQESMEEVDRLSPDPLSSNSADLLRQLLSIDTDNAQEDLCRATRRVSVHPVGASDDHQQQQGSTEDEDDSTVSMHIPYFGIIKISSSPNTALDLTVQRTTSAFSDANAQSYQETTNAATQGMLSSNDHYSLPGSQSMPTVSSYSASLPGVPPLQLPGDDLPGLAAGLDDWSFQGVDLAFFDSVMRNAERTRHSASYK